MQLTVIIVNYNVKHYVEQCLRAVVRAAERAEAEWEAYVVDNASQDGSKEHFEKTFPQADFPMIHCIYNARNVGFSRANNQAVKQAKGDYVLFLNPDTVVAESVFLDLFGFFKKQERVGAVGVKMLNDCGVFAQESRRAMPTPWVSFCKMSGLTALFPASKTFGKYYVGSLDKEQPCEVEILSGAFMLASCAALAECGSFDEDFFMYGEDIDLSYRFIKHGYKNFYLPSPILHYKGESTHKSSYRYAHVFYEAMLIFFRKHYGHLSWFFTFPIKCAIVFKALLTILQQQVRSIQPSAEDKLSFAYVGSQANYRVAQELAGKWQISLTDMGAVFSEAVLAEGGVRFTHILIDTSVVSYEAALRGFEKSDHRQSMAFFYPQEAKIVTGTAIYQ